MEDLQGRRALHLGSALAVALVIAGCDDATPSPSRARGSTPIAHDAPVTFEAVAATPAGPVALGAARSLHVADDGSRVALLEPGPEGHLRVGPPTALERVADRVEPGLFGCDGERIAFTRRRGDDPSIVDLWTYGPALARVDLGARVVDRVVGLSPDCAWAIVVTRARGLPVIGAVSLASGRHVALANHGMSLKPGQAPAGFTPPPTLDAPPRWRSARSFEYRASGRDITLALPEVDDAG